MKPLNQTKLNRRHWLTETAAASATGFAFSAGWSVIPARALGSNDRIGLGFIGTGARANAHIDICLKMKEVGRCEIVALCDVYRPRLEAAAQKTGAKVYRHYRDLLADPNVDSVCIATPDRHHAPQALDALRAGKDVFVEKPLTHWSQMDLATQLAQEAEKRRAIVQVGTQYVADDAYAKARELIRQGLVGKIVHVQLGYFRRGDWGERMPIPDPHAKPGPDLDWEQFLGDAPRVPFDVSRFFQWRLYWDYAGGPATDLLVHAFTPVFCLLELDYPERVLGGGGTFQYPREVPDQCNIIADYPGGPSVVMCNSLSNYTGIQTILRGTEGAVLLGDLDHPGKGIRIVPVGKESEEILIPWTSFGSTVKLWDNFLDCVRTRQRPYSPLDIGVRVQAPLNMGILSHREGKVARFDRQSGRILLG